MVFTMAFSSRGYEFGFREHFDKESPNRAIFGIFELFFKPINERIQGFQNNSIITCPIQNKVNKKFKITRVLRWIEVKG